MEHYNTYLVKALEAYPYDLEEAIESLNYALSYEPNNAMALSLFGRVYMDIYEDFETAIQYFETALAENVNLTAMYTHYTMALIHNEDYDKAKTFIKFALTVKSSDKGLLYARLVLIYECLQDYKTALKMVKKAEKHSYNDSFMTYLNEFKKRIKQKMPTKKTTKTKKKSKRVK